MRFSKFGVTEDNMKANYLGLLGILLLVIALSGTLSAQNNICSPEIEVYFDQCGNQFGCSDVFPQTFWTPCLRFGGPCYSFVSTSTNCCGIYQIYYDYSPWGCFWTKLQDAKFESKLAQLNQTEEILVPSCNGAYIPFQTAVKSKKG